MSTAEEQGWVPATYLESQNGTRDDSDINTSKTGEGMESLLVIEGKLVLAVLYAFPPVGNNYEGSYHHLWLLSHYRTFLTFLYQYINCCRRNWGKVHACNPFVTHTVTVTKVLKK